MSWWNKIFIVEPEKIKGTLGALDLRSPEEKAKDYLFSELVSSPAKVSLAETSPDRWKIYPKRNQDGSGTCVYQSRAKAAGILEEMRNGEFVVYSASDYNKRSNSPAAGAIPVESFDKWRTEGIGLETLEPSQDTDDSGVARVKQSEFEKRVAALSKLDAFMSLPIANFDTIVSTLHATRKPIPVCFYGSYQEWNRDIPTILSNQTLGNAEVRHSVCATPNYGIWQGQEGFTIEDSWGTAGISGTGVRFITRQFMARNYIGGLVPTTFKSYADMGVDPAKPKYKFTKVLNYGLLVDADVVALQNILKYENFFPANQSSTGNYYEVTRKGVLAFQQKHQVASPEELLSVDGRTVGVKTLEKLNLLYSI